MDTHFSLSDLVYASAKVEPVDHVCLWLGVSKKGPAFMCANADNDFSRPHSWPFAG